LNLPIGNALFERRNLNIVDINILVDNLINNKFSGYIAFWENNQKMKGGFFFCDGTIKNAIELDENGNIKLIKNPRLLNKIKIRNYYTSVYILSARISEILASSYIYDYIYRDFDIKKKDFKKILSSIELDSLSGFAVIDHRGNSYELVFSHGKIVADSFASEYGRIICQSDKIEAFIGDVMNNGARLNFFGEKDENIDEKDALARQKLESEKELKVKKMGGFIKAADSVKVDELCFKDWGIKPSVTISVDIETSDGNVHNIKCTSGKNMIGTVMLPDVLIKKYGVPEGETIYIKPKT